MPKDKILKIILLLSLVITMAVPAINYHYIYPHFTKLLISNTEEEAERTAAHIESMLIRNLPDVKKEYLPDDISAKVEMLMQDLKFLELKIFSREGEIIFATEQEDEGEINKHDYFNNFVKQGKKYTKVVQEDTTSLEGKIFKTDVVETYIPIMKDNNFIGAFEIYYDITKRYHELRSAVLYFSVFPLIIMLAFLIVITMTIYRLDRNIIDRRRAETELILYAEKLNMSNKGLEEFAYIASHDLQEPLRKITAFGDRLKEKYSDTLGEQGRDYLERMQSAADRMRNLIQGLLQFSRVATKAQPFEPVDLSKVAKEVLSDLEMRIRDTKGHVEVGKLPTISADTLQMRQLFQNFIGNALKFHKADQPPVIKVSAALVRDKKEDKGDQCRIIFEDNGIGFEEKHTERIFGMFQRLHGRQEYEGSGIGLSICKKIVERHCGNIAAKSAPGEGAAFIITLPVENKNY